MLSERIRALREECGLSQEALADEIGVTRQTVGKWESGDALPDVNNAVGLARRFGISVDELLEVNRNSRGEDKESWNIPNCVAAWPKERPSYTIRYARPGSVFRTWREIDGMYCLRKRGDVETYATYCAPGWELSRVFERRAVCNAALEETEGILFTHDVYLPSGFHIVRIYMYQAQIGDVIIPVHLATEQPVGKRAQLFRTPAGEIRCQPQQAWSVGPKLVDGSMVLPECDHLLLLSHSPSQQRHDLSSWDERGVYMEELPGEAMGVTGVYDVDICGVRHECTRLVHCWYDAQDDARIDEFYINKDGRTVLKRMYLTKESFASWLSVEDASESALQTGEALMLNDVLLFHTSDCFCSLAFKGTAEDEEG